MKSVLFLAVLAVCGATFAKGGGDQPMTPARFLEESIEYSVMLAQNTGATVTAVNTQSVDADTMNVFVTTGAGSVLNFECNIVDDYSHGGTVVKKDVLCNAK